MLVLFGKTTLAAVRKFDSFVLARPLGKRENICCCAGGGGVMVSS